MDAQSLTRLADNIYYAVKEERPEIGWEETIELVLERFLKKVPTLEREAARKIVTVVAHQYRSRELEMIQRQNKVHARSRQS
jgi:hypothetical protein